jgi:hypothetical protein
MFLKCSAINKWREELVYCKWLHVCGYVIEIRNVRQYLFKTRCKWEGKLSMTIPLNETSGEQSVW